MLAEYERLEKEIETIEKELEKCPDGFLICAKNGNYTKWYVSKNKKAKYIPKSKRSYAQKLAKKKYYTEKLDTLTKEQQAIAQYLQLHSNISEAESSSILLQPGYIELLTPFFKPTSEKVIEWAQEAYDKNPKHSEQLTIKTNSGNMVRSKSEAFIDMLLYANKIPFRYECALTLGNTTYYPDYTIMHPKSGNIFYWEHFGMMDDSIYAGKTFSKLHTYAKHGIIPSINLITTYETQKHPLDLDTVQTLIERYFL